MATRGNAKQGQAAVRRMGIDPGQALGQAYFEGSTADLVGCDLGADSVIVRIDLYVKAEGQQSLEEHFPCQAITGFVVQFCGQGPCLLVVFR